MPVSTARRALLAGVSTIVVAACGDDAQPPVDIVGGLEAAGVQVTEVFPDGAPPDIRYFDLWFTQPIDHGAPGGPTFGQYGALIHVDPDAPMVVYTSGYGAGRLRTP